VSIDISYSHPGKHLAEYLNEYGISQHYTADMAPRLKHYFVTSAQFWMNLQTDCDLSLA